MSNDSTRKTLTVALGVCLVCSILVSSAAVTLQKIQDENKRVDKLKNILIAGNLYDENTNVQKTFEEKIRGTIIDLATGKPIPESDYNQVLNVENFDIKSVARSEKYGERVPADIDIADVKFIPKFITVYKVMNNDNKMDEIILPIYGYGLWSTMYGFLALDHDLTTIRGITFYEDGETPGLGGEINNPAWKKLWVGKQAFDDQKNVRISVIKGTVDESSPDAKYEVDGLSGATLTSRGVDHTAHFWLGEHGYGPYLDNLREDMLNE